MIVPYENMRKRWRPNFIWHMEIYRDLAHSHRSCYTAHWDDMILVAESGEGISLKIFTSAGKFV
jgi:hypothetical protein